MEQVCCSTGPAPAPPGATMSGLMRPSVVGPKEEYSATLSYATAEGVPAAKNACTSSACTPGGWGRAHGTWDGLLKVMG